MPWLLDTFSSLLHTSWSIPREVTLPKSYSQKHVAKDTSPPVVPQSSLLFVLSALSSSSSSRFYIVTDGFHRCVCDFGCTTLGDTIVGQVLRISNVFASFGDVSQCDRNAIAAGDSGENLRVRYSQDKPEESWILHLELRSIRDWIVVKHTQVGDEASVQESSKKKKTVKLCKRAEKLQTKIRQMQDVSKLPMLGRWKDISNMERFSPMDLKERIEAVYKRRKQLWAWPTSEGITLRKNTPASERNSSQSGLCNDLQSSKKATNEQMEVPKEKADVNGIETKKAQDVVENSAEEERDELMSQKSTSGWDESLFGKASSLQEDDDVEMDESSDMRSKQHSQRLQEPKHLPQQEKLNEKAARPEKPSHQELQEKPTAPGVQQPAQQEQQHQPTRPQHKSPEKPAVQEEKHQQVQARKSPEKPAVQDAKHQQVQPHKSPEKPAVHDAKHQQVQARKSPEKPAVQDAKHQQVQPHKSPEKPVVHEAKHQQVSPEKPIVQEEKSHQAQPDKSPEKPPIQLKSPEKPVVQEEKHQQAQPQKPLEKLAVQQTHKSPVKVAVQVEQQSHKSREVEQSKPTVLQQDHPQREQRKSLEKPPEQQESLEKKRKLTVSNDNNDSHRKQAKQQASSAPMGSNGLSAQQLAECPKGLAALVGASIQEGQQKLSPTQRGDDNESAELTGMWIAGSWITSQGFRLTPMGQTIKHPYSKACVKCQEPVRSGEQFVICKVCGAECHIECLETSETADWTCSTCTAAQAGIATANAVGGKILDRNVPRLPRSGIWSTGSSTISLFVDYSPHETRDVIGTFYGFGRLSESRSVRLEKGFINRIGAGLELSCAILPADAGTSSSPISFRRIPRQSGFRVQLSEPRSSALQVDTKSKPEVRDVAVGSPIDFGELGKSLQNDLTAFKQRLDNLAMNNASLKEELLESRNREVEFRSKVKDLKNTFKHVYTVLAEQLPVEVRTTWKVVDTPESYLAAIENWFVPNLIKHHEHVRKGHLEMQQALDKLKEGVTKLEQSKKEMEKQNAQVRQWWQIAVTNQKGLEEKNSQLVSQIETQNVQLLNLMNQNQIATKNVQYLHQIEAENARLLNQIKAIDGERLKVDEERGKAIDRIRELEENLGFVLAKVEAQTAQLQEKTQEGNKLRQANEELKRLNADLKRASVVVVDDDAVDPNVHNELVRENEEMRKELAKHNELVKRNEEMRSELDKRSELVKQNEEMQRELASLQAKVQTKDDLLREKIALLDQKEELVESVQEHVKTLAKDLEEVKLEKSMLQAMQREQQHLLEKEQQLKIQQQNKKQKELREKLLQEQREKDALQEKLLLQQQQLEQEKQRSEREKQRSEREEAEEKEHEQTLHEKQPETQLDDSASSDVSSSKASFAPSKMESKRNEEKGLEDDEEEKRHTAILHSPASKENEKPPVPLFHTPTIEERKERSADLTPSRTPGTTGANGTSTRLAQEDSHTTISETLESAKSRTEERPSRPRERSHKRSASVSSRSSKSSTRSSKKSKKRRDELDPFRQAILLALSRT